MTHPSLIGFEAKVMMKMASEAPPVCEQIEAEELRRLRRASAALGDILDMADDAFRRGRLSNAADVPLIALTAKIIDRGRKFRDPESSDAED